MEQADCSTSDPLYSSWEPYPEAYSPGPASDDEEALPALDPVGPPLTPIAVNHPAWLATLPFANLPLPDGLLADPIAAYRRLPIEEPEIETVMEDPSSVTATIRALCAIWLTWLLGVRWQVLLLLLPNATCGLLHTNEGAQVSAADPEGSQVTSGSIVWALSFVYLAWVLGVPRQDLVPFVAGAAFIMLPDVEGARTRRSARLSLTAEERTASYVLAAVPVYIWIVLSFVYRLRRQAALALRKRALSCLQRRIAQSKLQAKARANHATRSLLKHPPRALPLEVGCDKNGVLLQRDGHGIVHICSARHGFNQDGSHTAPTFPPPYSSWVLAVSDTVDSDGFFYFCYYDTEQGETSRFAPDGPYFEPLLHV